MTKPSKAPKCKSCKQPFVRYNTIQRLCVKCAIEKVKQDNDKKHRKETREARQRLKTKSDWLREAQAAFNTYIRKRDAGQPCISCGRNSGAKMNAGHYFSVGAHPELRFNEDNCHLQCEHCNSYLSGNIAAYRPNLIEKIGLERVEWLEGPHQAKHRTIDDIKAIKAEYKQKAKELTPCQWVTDDEKEK